MDNIAITNGMIIHPRITIKQSSTGINLAQERQLTVIDRIVNHHPVSGTMPEMAGINAWWRGNRNWDRAGYHLIIRNDGSIWQLVPLWVPAWGAGAAANGRGVQIAIAGTFTATNSPSRAAQDAYGWLVNQLLISNQLPNLNHITHVTRHSDWMATSCSGYTTEQAHAWIKRTMEVMTQSENPINKDNGWLEVGKNVRIQKGTRWLDQNTIVPSFVSTRLNQIHSINGNRIVISYNGIVLGAVARESILRGTKMIEVGSQVRVHYSAYTWATGEAIPHWVKGQIYRVEQIRNKNSEVLLSSVRSWIRVSDVRLI